MMSSNLKWLLVVSLFFFQESFSQVQELNFMKLDTLLKQGRNYSALQYLNSYDTLKLKQSDLGLFHLYKAKSLTAKNDNAKAFSNYLTARRVFIAIDSVEKAMAINLDIAFFLNGQKSNNNKAEKYIDEYLAYALKEKNNLAIAKAYSAWGSLLMEDQPEESTKLFKKAIYYSEQAKNAEQFEKLYSNLGVFYNEILQKPDSAIIFIDKSMTYGLILKNNNSICINLINKAGCYYYKKEYKKAIILLEEANKIALMRNEKNIKSYIYEFLALNYSELGDFENAYKNLSSSTTTRAEFNFDDQNTKISELNIKYQTQEREIENLKLKAEVARGQIISYSFLGIFVISIVFSILIYNNLSKKKKIAEQSQLIEIQRLEKTLKDQELHDIDLMLQSQEHERQEIANELHDNLGSLLATLKLNFQNLKRLQSDNDLVLFDKTDKLLEETYQKVRNISHLKNLGIVGNDGLLVAVKIMADKMSVINRLKINVIPFGLTQRFTNTVEVTLFRMVQELCTNIIKHSGADEVNIYLTQHNDDSINIIIEDNGKGFNFKKVARKDGIGLKSIEKKVEQMEGTFTVDSVENKGTTIIIDLPL